MDLYCDYDENLSQNAFFRKLQSDHKIIIETAPLENWIICIPRAATIQTPHLSSSDFLLAHVLIPNEELPQSHFTSLSGIDVRLEQKRLIANAQRTEIGEDTPTESIVNASNRIESLVLFEEVFYAKHLLKYKVWCIETPLLFDSTAVGLGAGQLLSATPPGIYVVRDAKDAAELIWSETHSNAIFRKIDAACVEFGKSHSTDHSGTLSDLRQRVERLYGQCMQHLVANKVLKEKCRMDGHFYKIIRIALETYIMNIVYTNVFDQIVLATQRDGELFNRALRSLADSNCSYFGVGQMHMDAVTCVRAELLKIEEYGTAIEKMGECICILMSKSAHNK